jgi:hypothetical protein
MAQSPHLPVRRLLIVSEDGIVPAAGTLDLVARVPVAYRNLGPLLAAVSYWVHTPYVRPDPELPGGGFDLTLRWLDPVDQVRQMGGYSVDLNDASAWYSCPVQMINRRSGDSLLELALGAINMGSARVSYRVALLPSAPSDLLWCD